MDFMDWVTGRLLGSTQEELVEEALPPEIERLQSELLLAVQELADDEMVPVRLFMVGVAAQQSGHIMSQEEQLTLPLWETAGWFRARIRSNLAEVSRP